MEILQLERCDLPVRVLMNAVECIIIRFCLWRHYVLVLCHQSYFSRTIGPKGLIGVIYFLALSFTGHQVVLDSPAARKIFLVKSEHAYGPTGLLRNEKISPLRIKPKVYKQKLEARLSTLVWVGKFSKSLINLGTTTSDSSISLLWAIGNLDRYKKTWTEKSRDL